MFNYLNNEKRLWNEVNFEVGRNSSENCVFSYICEITDPDNNLSKTKQTIKRGIFTNMNMFFKIAAGIVGGIAIIASLGGFSKKTSEKKNVESSDFEREETIPDDIFDGNVNVEYRKGQAIQRKTEQGVRSLQEGLSKASNVLGQISIICSSIVKMFYDDPCIRTNPTTIIC